MKPKFLVITTILLATSTAFAGKESASGTRGGGDLRPFIEKGIVICPELRKEIPCATEVCERLSLEDLEQICSEAD